MCVDAFGDAFKRMAENELNDGPIYVSRVEHACKRVAALVRCVRHAKVTHDRVEDGSAERVVAVPAAICSSADVEPRCLHGLLIPRQELAWYRDESTSSCIGLAMPDHDDATAQLDVGLTDVTVFADTTAGVDEHEYMTRFWHIINATPQAVALTDSKRLFLVQLLRPVDVEVARVVFYDKIVPQGILVL